MFRILINTSTRLRAGTSLLSTLALVGASPAGAQSAPAVQGIVFDSLRGVPLAGAFVSIAGLGRATTSDARGRFRFDSLGPGTYTLAFQHDVLDSIGVASVSSRAVVRGPSDEVTIAVPSFASLWRRWCPGVAPNDTGFVHGVIRDVAGKPVARATVEVTWTDLNAVGKTIEQRGKRGRVTTDDDGQYAACGVPATTMVQLHASRDSATSGTLDIVLGDLRVSRRDLRVVAASQGVGTVAGLVTRGGQPFAGARVVVEDRPEQRTGADGRFVIRDVVAGTKQVSIFAVGMSPGAIVVDVPVQDTALVNYELQKVVSLPGVNVSESSVRQHLFAEYEDRKKQGFGHYRDSTEIGRYAGLAAAFSSIPGTIVRSKNGRAQGVYFMKASGQCEAMYLLDGLRADRDQVADLTPDGVAAVEVYERATMVPSSISGKLPLGSSCGAVVIWTKRFVP